MRLCDLKKKKKKGEGDKSPKHNSNMKMQIVCQGPGTKRLMKRCFVLTHACREGCSPRLPGVWVGHGAAPKAQELLSLCVHMQDAFPAWKGTFMLLSGLRNPGNLAAVGEDLA